MFCLFVSSSTLPTPCPYWYHPCKTKKTFWNMQKCFGLEMGRNLWDFCPVEQYWNIALEVFYASECSFSLYPEQNNNNKNLLFSIFILQVNRSAFQKPHWKIGMMTWKHIINCQISSSLRFFSHIFILMLPVDGLKYTDPCEQHMFNMFSEMTWT